MGKLIGVYEQAVLTECPDKWDEHKGHPSFLFILESEKKAPGKKWFKIVYDKDFYNNGYLRSSLGDMTVDEEANTVAFDTGSGSHYELDMGYPVDKDRWNQIADLFLD